MPGEGNPDTEVVFVGEGPGFNEDRQGRPFVGRAGDLLVKLLGSIGWRREDVFITNVVKCRPPDNRDPEPDEIAACAPYLRRQLEVLDPALVVTLGRFSMGRFMPGARISPGPRHGPAGRPGDRRRATRWRSRCTTRPPRSGRRPSSATSYDDIAARPGRAARRPRRRAGRRPTARPAPPSRAPTRRPSRPPTAPTDRPDRDLDDAPTPLDRSRRPRPTDDAAPD